MHVPVMPDEVLEALAVREGGWYVDGTLGGGGHAEMILRAGGRVLGLDRDADAIGRVCERLAEYKERVRLVKSDFKDMRLAAESVGLGEVDGVLLDLGVSSFQLDEAERGFSFQQDGPLDMRMDRSGSRTAAAIVNGASRDELARIFREYGEEPMAWRLAGAIVEARAGAPFERTGQLADVLSRAVGGRRGPRHPATRAFQALRMEVNGELESLAGGLEGGLNLLRAGGRLVVISFHSLEDRLVKRMLNRHAGRMESLQQGGARWVGESPRVSKVVRRVCKTSSAEIGRNRRARSARMRVVERM